MSAAVARVFIAQQNFTVGAIDRNAALIRAAAQEAAGAGASVLLTPEMALMGYPAEDLLYSPTHLAHAADALGQLAQALPPQLAVLVGTPAEEAGNLYNACALLRGGRVEAVYKKAHLPNFSVFDEKRYFHMHDNPPLVFEASGAKYAVQICQDIWTEAQYAPLAACAADAILVPNGSPFVAGKQAERIAAAAACARAANAAVVYANGIGAQDELVFDGASFAVDAGGNLTAQLPAFAACNAAAAADNNTPYPLEDDAVFQALLCGLRDYVEKSRFARGVVLGLSGGVDSALVAALAHTALGADKVCTVMMPTDYTSRESLEDSRQLAHNLGVEHINLPIRDALSGLHNTIAPHLRARANDVSAENLQARLRGTLLMALANNRDLLLLATGNKSEFACGYATLYGDMNGGFAPIKDVLKTKVWQLARHYNAQVADFIPQRIISRAPSAELRPDQTDQDSLPPYETLDAIILDHLSHRPRGEMEKEHGEESVKKFYQLLHASEHKRRQAPPGTKISPCAFGRDWRMPVANGHAH